MKTSKYTLLLALLSASLNLFAQGDTYTNSIFIDLDGNVKDYSSSASVGANVICTSTSTSPITWFSFTTNSSAHCPLLNISAADSLPVEIALYTSITGNMNNNLNVESGMCFNDGYGLWAPAETFVLEADQTYYLRIKTSTNCLIYIGGQHYAPPNDECGGALPISVTPLADNNACHLPGPDVSPDQLCAFTLENTAFYQYYVASSGTTIINISNISCDNGGIDNSSGFQIGFFTGNCPFLNPLSCTSGQGSFVQATSPPLTAGTKVYVAIDGNGGSNCSYSIAGINVTTVLEIGIRNFSAWKTPHANKLSWKTNRGFNGHSIYIQRSIDGIEFSTIGTVNPSGPQEEEKFYQFEDQLPPMLGFYRLMTVTGNDKKHYSVVKEVRRTDQSLLTMQFQNPVVSDLNAVIYTANDSRVDIRVLSITGQTMWKASVFCKEGPNTISKDFSMLPEGKYILSLYSGKEVFSKAFIRLK